MSNKPLNQGFGPYQDRASPFRLNVCLDTCDHSLFSLKPDLFPLMSTCTKVHVSYHRKDTIITVTVVSL